MVRITLPLYSTVVVCTLSIFFSKLFSRICLLLNFAFKRVNDFPCGINLEPIFVNYKTLNLGTSFILFGSSLARTRGHENMIFFLLFWFLFVVRIELNSILIIFMKSWNTFSIWNENFPINLKSLLHNVRRLHQLPTADTFLVVSKDEKFFVSSYTFL